MLAIEKMAIDDLETMVFTLKEYKTAYKSYLETCVNTKVDFDFKHAKELIEKVISGNKMAFDI